MARPQLVDDAEVLGRLSQVFRDVGYEGASLALLSAATGLKKASLYHRFPGGKQQMAEEVIAGALGWYEANVMGPLNAKGDPRARITTVAANLDDFHAQGQKACLFNMLAAPKSHDGPFTDAIRGAFEELVAAFTKVCRDAGCDAKTARWRAHRAVMMLQGALVVTRGLGSQTPFAIFLAGLADDLVGETAARVQPSVRRPKL
jgi:TetR/AcrR family transcriptional regulator, lmrAB and yxaGH operons repressor